MLLNQSEPGSAKPTRPRPAERIERSAIERLIPYADDARLRSEADIDDLANSLRQWGSTIPVHAVRHRASGQSFDEHAARHNHTPGGTGYGETTFCRQ